MSTVLTVDVHSIDGLAATRHRVSDFLTAEGADEDVLANCQMVLTELAVNAFEHGHAAHVQAHISAGDAGIIVTLRHTDSGTPPDPTTAQIPPATSMRGRGLALARALSASLTRHLDGRTTVTVATFDPPSPVGDPQS